MMGFDFCRNDESMYEVRKKKILISLRKISSMDNMWGLVKL